jgi:uncharacterized protein
MKSILFAAMLALTFAQASAASFDCAKARSANEKAICSNAELGSLDERLNAVYRDLRVKFSPDFFKREVQPRQLNWLKSLRQCTPTVQKGRTQVADEQCLIKAFKSRISELTESLTAKHGYMIFEGRVDSPETIFKEYGFFSPISKDLFRLDSSGIDDTVERRGRMSCYYDFNLVSKSGNRLLKFEDMFILNKKQELISAVKKAIFQIIKKPDQYQIDNITDENIEERLEALEFEELDSTRFLLSSWPVGVEGCPMVFPGERLPTSLLRPYLTPYARSQLGL